MNTPVLDDLLECGIVRISGNEIIGQASDGVRVSFGCYVREQDLESIERYLKNNPTPDCW